MDSIVNILGALLGVAVDGTGNWTEQALGTAAFQATAAFDAAGAATTAQTTAETYAAGLVGALLQNAATTGAAGTALINGTQNIVTWTAPNDANLHRAMIFASQHITGAETGGQVTVSYTLPDGTAATHTLFQPAQGIGDYIGSSQFNVLVKGNTAVTIAQSTALTVGAATVWAEIWAL